MNNKKGLRFIFMLAMITLLSACGGGGGGGSSSGSSSNNQPPAAGSEGTLTSPVMLSLGGSLPYSGKVSVNGPSYYLVTGLTEGAAYSVTLGNVTGSIIPFLYSSDTNSNLQSCFYSAVSSTGSCIVQASATGAILISTANYSTSGSSTYSINVALAADPGQGTPSAPVTITSPNSYTGSLTSGVSTTTYDQGNSGYYRLTGLTAGHRYSITLSSISVGADLYVYQDSYGAKACSSTYGGTTDEYCTITAKTNALLLQIPARDQGSFTISYTDMGAAIPFIPQGGVGSEVVLTLDAMVSMDNGSVNDGKSYYTVTGLVPGQAYYAYLRNPTDNINLYVYSDSGYTKLTCSSTLDGTKDEFCNAVPDASGQLWLVADGSNALANLGSSYTIGVERIAPVLGSSIQPQAISAAAELPYRVSAGNKSKSYYKITGLAANTVQMVTLFTSRSVEGDFPYMSVYPATGFGIASCTTNGSYYDHCTGTTDSQGELFVSVEVNNAAGGTGYIDVKPMPVSQGTATIPLAEDMSVLSNRFSGQVVAGTDSYYALTGLTPNTSYYILAGFGVGESAETKVFNTFSGNLANDTAVCSMSWSYLNNGCTATSDASGRLWVEIGSWYVDVGTYFDIEALPAAASQGLLGAPLDITTLLPYRSSVASDDTSYYMVTGLAANAEYLFSKSDTSGNEYLGIYNDSAFTSLVCQPDFIYMGREAFCRGKPTGSTVYIRVDNTGYVMPPSYHYLDVAPVPAAEGSAASPVVIGSSHGGSVNVGTSYYRASLAANTTYTVTLTGVSGDPDLYVFNDPTMSGPAVCSSIRGSNQTESCQATSDSNGNLWIVVDGELSRKGASYSIQIN